MKVIISLSIDVAITDSCYNHSLFEKTGSGELPKR